jgi:hypothetical protein
MSVTAAVFWVVLAWRTPTSTHHFAPFIVAMLWGFLERSTNDDGNLGRAATGRAFLGGAGVAIGATALLFVADKLQGPGLYGSLPVIPELVVHSFLGATVGGRPWTLLRATAPNHTPFTE